MPRRKPTIETHAELQRAYDFYNRRLFEGRLPACMIRLERTRTRTYGYFAAEKWKSGRARSDEIAMNPEHFTQAKMREVLQTLVHEMAHLWQHHFTTRTWGGRNNPPSRGYHDKEWAGKMIEVGLHPSSTGRPGGKQTGYAVADYVIKGGRFDVVTRELLAGGFELKWHGRSAGRGREALPDKPQEERPAAGRRSKYTCPQCHQNAWARPGAKLMCGVCKKGMKVMGLAPTGDGKRAAARSS